MHRTTPQTRIVYSMCGILACLNLSSTPLDHTTTHERVLAGLERIKHRGPDGFGIWLDEEHGRCGELCASIEISMRRLTVALGHCRLSINDLSAAGAQPLHSASNTVHAVVNGEIYDHDRLRDTLPYAFTGRSDSELVLALYETHGLDFLSHLRGEFALVLYDSRRDIFIAARDRYGIKPLFWRRSSGRIWLGAEMKAFLGTEWKPEWDVQAIMDGGWGQDARTVFKDVQKVSQGIQRAAGGAQVQLRPGHYMISAGGGEPEIRQYWDISYPAKVSLPVSAAPRQVLIRRMSWTTDQKRRWSPHCARICSTLSDSASRRTSRWAYISLAASTRRRWRASPIISYGRRALRWVAYNRSKRYAASASHSTRRAASTKAVSASNRSGLRWLRCFDVAGERDQPDPPSLSLSGQAGGLGPHLRLKGSDRHPLDPTSACFRASR